MNKILLINRLNPQDYTEKKKKVCFVIGGMNIPKVEDRLVEILSNTDILRLDDILYKYNGVELNITTQQIPIVTRLLTKNNIDIYSIFEVYNPEI
ncbi:MAG: hypothetical protein GX053_05915 [Tissierella sp.]|nr:hypothetical protein [Tissierella sp.]